MSPNSPTTTAKPLITRITAESNHTSYYRERCGLGLCVPLAADDAKPSPFPDRARKELDRLQGKWVAKEFGRRGKTVDVKEQELVLEIKGDKWIFVGKEKGQFIAFDPTADPKCVEAVSKAL